MFFFFLNVRRNFNEYVINYDTQYMRQKRLGISNCIGYAIIIIGRFFFINNEKERQKPENRVTIFSTKFVQN